MIKHKCYIVRYPRDKNKNMTQNFRKRSTSKIDLDLSKIENTISKLHDLITTLTIKNGTVFDYLTDNDFKSLSEIFIKLGADYGSEINVKQILPTSEEISENITLRYDLCFQTIKDEIESYKKNGFGLAADTWTDRFTGNSFVALTMQFWKNGALCNRLLGLKLLVNVFNIGKC